MGIIMGIIIPYIMCTKTMVCLIYGKIWACKIKMTVSGSLDSQDEATVNDVDHQKAMRQNHRNFD